jgi:hypothetical protein
MVIRLGGLGVTREGYTAVRKCILAMSQQGSELEDRVGLMTDDLNIYLKSRRGRVLYMPFWSIHVPRISTEVTYPCSLSVLLAVL